MNSNVQGPFEKSARNMSHFASNLVYSILTTFRIHEIQNETPDYTTMSNLMLGNPELYRIVLYKTEETGNENYRFD